MTHPLAKFHHARALHQRGQLNDAQRLFEEILKSQPGHLESVRLLGMIAIQTRHFERALQLIDTALQIEPADAAAHFNRGWVLQELKQFERALKSYDRAIELKADYAKAHFMRGTALQATRQLGAALESYNRAKAIQPDFAEAYLNRGVVLEELKQLPAALASYEQAIAIKSTYAEAFSNRGLVLQALGRLDLALESHDRAIALMPNYAEAYSNRGNVLTELKQFAAALASYDHAVSIKPDYARAYSNRGRALQELDQWDAALASYERAIGLNPGLAEAYSNRGTLFYELGQIDAALANYDKAIQLDPTNGEMHFNRSVAWLTVGDYEHGWREYEWRWKNERGSVIKEKRTLAAPLWLGEEPIAGKTILVYSEQGLGDTLQFCRYIGMLADLGAQVILEVQPQLLGLLCGLAGASQVLVRGANLPEYDIRCPLMSLPLAFNTTPGNVPHRGKYLPEDSTATARWQHRLGPKNKLRIGLAWSGNKNNIKDRARSIPLTDLMPHLPSQFQYVSLQADVRPRDLAVLQSNTGILHFADELDFVNTAALCQCMDLIITVDTSIAHLSGALGRRTWILLSSTPDWRWMRDGETTPWYSAVTLYRQASRHDWAAVFARVNADLLALSGRHAMLR
jgi:tetratricopeptide (TPR) repeat protein